MSPHRTRPFPLYTVGGYNETVSLTVVLRPLAELLLLLPQLVAARRPVHAGEDSALRVAVVAGAPLGRAGHHIVLGGGGAT